MSVNLEQLYSELCSGNLEAYDFLMQWEGHCHTVDDICDGEITDSLCIVKGFVTAQCLILHPFFVKHQARLWPILLLSANAYSDSLLFQNSSEDYKKQIGDYLRSFSNEMLLIVGMLCARDDETAWDKVRKISPLIRELSYKKHHNENGEPI